MARCIAHFRLLSRGAIAGCCAFVLALAVAGPVRAQAGMEGDTVTAAASSASSASSAAPTVASATPPDDGGVFGNHTDVSIGMGAGLDQRYMGARAFRPLLVPMLNVSRGIFFADTTRGAGIQYQSASGFYIGEALNYDTGRDDGDNWLRPGADRLARLGSVKGSLTSTLTVSQQIVSWLSANAQAEFGLDGRRGNQYQLGLESIAARGTQDPVTLDANVKLGDRRYNQTYFGVTRAQSVNSGYDGYAPGGGVYAYALSVTWDHHFDRHWTGELIVSGSFYTDKAANSPIAQRRVGVTVLPSVSYAF
ncbi:MipA/OmpV family protein [Robbsia sp. Bb-Pol-6]|uniref:MipA/OmpV family protein n=1 Tax=Robbsia betulipollinis TaxID=2981849 RepID=A0ABT3ZLY4_9BURK|nr:MipA/OmpV family protein [Robbsia betulipollinis]MCY0386960.1 MipA/OmpV family protein [Robbsia betulipollinis]